MVAIDFHGIPPPPAPDYGSQWLPSTVWLLTFFKISSFVFSSFNNYSTYRFEGSLNILKQIVKNTDNKLDECAR